MLEFADLRIDPEQGLLTRLPMNLALQPGELILLGVSYLEQASIIADVAAGLVRADSGSVSFLGHDWSRLSGNGVYALRGRIGRLLTRGRWIEGMSILENILLPQLHHSARSRNELLHEAMESARRFGLPGVPTTGYQDMLPEDMQRAGCVRAFLGSPALVLLPEPTLGSKSDMLPPLVNACLDAIYRGAAILWLTQRSDLIHDSKIPATRRFVINVGALEELHA